jgi:hypothetical protein
MQAWRCCYQRQRDQRGYGRHEAKVSVAERLSHDPTGDRAE